MTDPKLRIAVIGLGNIAREAHLPILRSEPGIEVVGLVDRDPGAHRRGQRLAGAPAPDQLKFCPTSEEME